MQVFEHHKLNVATLFDSQLTKWQKSLEQLPVQAVVAKTPRLGTSKKRKKED
jgi:hypothetical protein